MKIKFLSIIAAFFFVSLTITSCLDSDDNTIAYPADATIRSFSINNIKTTVIRKNDTIKFTVDGDDYPFTIDQQLRVIYNPDSLPFNTNVSKVSLNITTAGGPVYYKKNDKDTLWTTVDSLDFTKAVGNESALEFKVYSPDFQMSWAYKVWINVHKQVPDSLVWGQIKEAEFPGASITGKQKAVLLGNKIYVFAEVSSEVKVTSTSVNDGKSWVALSTLNGINGKVDYSSVIIFDNKLFIVADGQVYSSEDAINWNVASAPGSDVKTLITSFTNNPIASTRLYKGDKRLIGVKDDRTIVVSFDGMKWEETANMVSADFPINNFAATLAYLNPGNPDIERAVVVGATVSNDTAAVVFTILSNENSYTQISPSEGTLYNCPKLLDLSLIHYGDLLYAFGGKGVSDDIQAFQYFYSSRDNGISWRKVTENVLFPHEFLGRNDSFSYTIDNNNFIWIMWAGTGEVWKGRINRLGFIK